MDGGEFVACNFHVTSNESRGGARVLFSFLVYGNQLFFTTIKKLGLSLFIFRKEKLNLKAVHSHVVSCSLMVGEDSVCLFIEDFRWK